MSKGTDFRSTTLSLWFRLITLGIVALVFSEALILAPGKAQGWNYYLTIPEVTFEVIVRLVAAALAGIALGTIATLLIAPFLWLFGSSRERVSDWTIKIAVVLVVFLVWRLALKVLIQWSYSLASHRAIYDIALYAPFVMAFVAALIFPRTRKEILTSLDGFLSKGMTRRIAIATVVATVALVLVEFAFSKATLTVKAAIPQQHPKSNVLLITFDAMDAEDMSLYGRDLPTTPNIDAFARKGTVFKNFYSASTFTTSSVASMMTGSYLPDAVDRGRFLPNSEHNTYEEESGNRWKPHYPPNQQSLADQRRLRYDEFIATADRAFGAFVSDMESTGKLQNTTVIVSAEQGESFEGGVYQHSSPYLTRPVIHIPLIIRTPGQQDSRTVSVIADQTSLTPTILELAGVPIPAWMRGLSLVPWLNRDSQGEGEGLAFTQYFERNSVFKPLHHGSIGVIDGQYQYVYYLETQKGELRPLNEAQIWNLDRSAEEPARADALRSALLTRFPDPVQ